MVLRAAALPALGLAALLLLAAPAASQVPASAILELTPPPATAVVAIAPATTTWSVPWTLTYANAVASAQGAMNLTLDWTLTCQEAITLLEPASTLIPFTPGEGAVQGVAQLQVRAAETALGGATACSLIGRAHDANNVMQAADSVAFTTQIEPQLALVATPQAADRQAGPQKLIPYPILLENQGNSLMRVHFEVADEPEGKWLILVPETVTLEPGQSLEAIATVATPFENGYNKGSSQFVLHAIPSLVDGNGTEVVGAPVEVVLNGHVKGWYVPGPALPLVALALAGLAAWARRVA